MRYKDIHVKTVDTDIMLFDIGSHTSRSTYVIGNAAVNAGQKIRQMILERAARRLKVQVDSFDIKEGGIVYGKYYH